MPTNGYSLAKSNVYILFTTSFLVMLWALLESSLSEDNEFLNKHLKYIINYEYLSYSLRYQSYDLLKIKSQTSKYQSINTVQASRIKDRWMFTHPLNHIHCIGYIIPQSSFYNYAYYR